MMLRRYHNGKQRQSETGRNEGHEAQTQQETEGPAENNNEQRQETQGKSLDEYTVPELQQMAKDREITGYSAMKKDELLEALGGEEHAGSGETD
ncbi:hypothetical protein BTR22_18635 [Alkalihalophilus pseudofirmus]|uniref:Rho termination factor N-terminal domain-containing protein n=1 Tax=Alkalihalophilus pseudofirmus TaxID=79885 RepID=UPI0009512AF1|nr:hypothetical protein BTR22_18635 [Alkalihalophilus pseudofirmus]